MMTMPTGMTRRELAAVELAGVIAYLLASGWREAGTYEGAVIWTNPADSDEGDADAEVLLPTSSQMGDYPNRLAELIDTLSEVEERPAADVLRDLRSTGVDVQYVRTIPDGPSGTIPLHEGFLAIKNVRDLFLAAATSAVSDTRPTVLPSQKPPEAQGFLDRVRLGQTGRGSYVLRVETPLPEPDAQPAVSSRDVLLHMYQAANAAHDAARGRTGRDLGQFAERIGEGVSANLCDALAGIGGLRRSPFELRFAWAPAAPVREPTPTLTFDSESIATLKSAAGYLRKLPTTAHVTVTGRVVDLHQTPMDRLGRVEVDGLVQEPGTEPHSARVRFRLPARSYELAVLAHGQRKPLRFTGPMRHTGRQYEMTEVATIEIVDN